MTHITLDPNKMSIAELHSYLLSAVAPRPIAFASTVDAKGNVNLSPFSYFNVFGVNPPLLIFSPARRVRDNTIKHTLENVREVPEVVINMVDYKMVEQMSLASTEYERGVNEFIKSGLTEIKSDIVKAPRVAESPVAFECTVEQIIATGSEGGAGNLVICKVLKIHIRDILLDGDGKLDPLKLDLVGRMGGSWYCRTSKESLFEIPKPVRTKGIGVDRLPESARSSHILTGNNLGRMGNAHQIPDKEKRMELSKNPAVRGALEGPEDKIVDSLHKIARTCLEKGKVSDALACIFIAEDFV